MVILVFPWTAHADAIKRFITSIEDFVAEGTLRTVLHDACNNPGDDIIIFHDFDESQFKTLTITLHSPLSIPKDCNGSVVIDGKPLPGVINPEPIISGARLSGDGRTPGDLCMLNVYSDNHIIQNLTFMGAKTGAAICFFGRRNMATGNRFNTSLSGIKSPNRFDIVISSAFVTQFPNMTGEGNTVRGNRSESSGLHSMWVDGKENLITENMIQLATESGIVAYGTGNKLTHNTISQNGNHGIVIAGNSSIVFGNTISANGGCPIAPFQSQPTCNTTSSMGGAGIYVSKTGGSAEIGHAESNKRNIIQYNISGGVILENSANIMDIHIFHNTISRNYGANIDLADDGMTSNDLGDLDIGPNTLFNTAEHVQMFPLVSGPNGDRYWGWGLAFDATSAELATVDSEEQQKKLTFGGATIWISDFVVTDHTFGWLPDTPAVAAGTQLTPLVHYNQNTSEYGLNIWVKSDADLDGIPDDLETQSNPNEADSDLDGLPDPVEDQNRNGICDKDETCAYLADTDGDGLSDWAETRGDGRFDPKVDSNPWVADTDGDGLLDGKEDLNNNGKWDGFLGESSPLIADSDSDGIGDSQDTCKIVQNPQQETWFCL
jgi:parallel beta-helix repeat protein